MWAWLRKRFRLQSEIRLSDAERRRGVYVRLQKLHDEQSAGSPLRSLASDCLDLIRSQGNRIEELNEAATVWQDRYTKLSAAYDLSHANIMLDGNDVLICFGDHEKGEKCEYIRFVPQSSLTAAQAESENWRQHYVSLLAETQALRHTLKAKH